MKALEFIYQETEIAFVLGNEKNIMVNATEMAKAFGKRTDHFLQNENTKAFIEAIKVPDFSGTLIENRGRNGIYFERRLALKFAAWLDVQFEVWIYNVIDDLLFGSAKAVGKKITEKEKAKKELSEIVEKIYSTENKEAIQLLNQMQLVKSLEKETNKEFSNLKKQYSIFD